MTTAMIQYPDGVGYWYTVRFDFVPPSKTEIIFLPFILVSFSRILAGKIPPRPGEHTE